MSQNDGGPAFPRWTDNGSFEYPGMSLRDWFAGQALGALAVGYVTDPHEMRHPYLRNIARLAYEYADAALAARTDTTKKEDR